MAEKCRSHSNRDLLLLRLHLISSLFAVSEGLMMSFIAAASTSFLQLNSHLFIHIFLFRMAAALLTIYVT